ncbi:MAG: hypothetical protein ACQKBY_03935 [Verrucomicrobiales bacterium]
MNQPRTRVLLALILSALPLFVSAQERTWTDASSGKTLTGVLIDKKDEPAQARILTPAGQAHWIDIARLSETDQKFIADWVKPPEHLRVAYQKDASGRITALLVRATANDKICAFLAKPVKEGQSGSDDFIFHSLQPGESKDIELPPGQSYTLSVSEGESQKVLARMSVKAVAGTATEAPDISGGNPKLSQ